MIELVTATATTPSPPSCMRIIKNTINTSGMDTKEHEQCTGQLYRQYVDDNYYCDVLRHLQVSLLLAAGNDPTPPPLPPLLTGSVADMPCTP